MTDKQPTAADEISGYQKAMRQTGSGTASVQAAQLARWHAAIKRKDALLKQALDAITHGCPPDCNDGMTDSGGTYPWGEAVLMPCPTCETVRSITKELSE